MSGFFVLFQVPIVSFPLRGRGIPAGGRVLRGEQIGRKQQQQQQQQQQEDAQAEEEGEREPAREAPEIGRIELVLRTSQYTSIKRLFNTLEN